MKPAKRKRIVLGIDDRIPSKIAASILRNQDFDLVAVHLRIDLGIDQSLYPSAFHRADPENIESACASLGIPLKTIDVTDETIAKVFDPYWVATLGAQADSPSIRWLRDVMLPNLLRVADAYGAETVATGHFARLMGHVLRYSEPAIDQSLAFAAVDASTLARLTLPLGEVSSDMIVRLARELDFLPKVETDYDGSEGQRALVENWKSRGNWRWEHAVLADLRVQQRAAGDFFKPGPIQSVEEFVSSEHAGLPFYSLGSPIPEHYDQFVIDVLPQSRTLVIGRAEHLDRGGAYLKSLNWTEELTGKARERTIHVVPLPSGNAPDSLALPPLTEPVSIRLWEYPGGLAEARFETPIRGLAPGQTLVFLERAQVLGSATVVSTQAAEKRVEKAAGSE